MFSDDFCLLTSASLRGLLMDCSSSGSGLLLRHASFKTTMDGYTQALEEPKRQAQAALADLMMRTGTAFHAMILMNCCGVLWELRQGCP